MKFENKTVTVKVAQQSDWERIIEIYNSIILETGKTADTQIQTLEQRREWLLQHLTPRTPILLLLIDDRIVGWCSLSPYRPGRKALESVAEISYYLERSFRGKGFGSFLIDESIRYAKKHGIRHLVAILLDINTTSVNVLRKFGFQKWGHLPNIAEIGDMKCGQFIYGRTIK